MRVAVLGGGRTLERNASLGTAAAIAAGVSGGGHDVAMITIERSGAWVHEGRRVVLEPGAGLLGCDVVFPAIPGPAGGDGRVQSMLDLLDIPYVGTGALGSLLCSDRAALRATLATSRVPQVRYATVPEERWRSSAESVLVELAEVGPPAFVVPGRNQRLSRAVKVTRPQQFVLALETTFSHADVAVVEEYRAGVEVRCAVIGLREPETSVPGARPARADCPLQTPAVLPDAVVAEVQRLARETFIRLGCAGMACVILLVEGAHVLVQDVKTLPGFAPMCDFAQLWAATGTSLPELCDRLLSFAGQGFASRRRLGARDFNFMI